MPWKECSIVSEREEFVKLVELSGANVSVLCRRFGISRKTGYKWLKRFAATGSEGLRSQSRRPRRWPKRTPAVVEQSVTEVREEHPAWGGRKIRRVLQDEGRCEVPAASTITMILRRHGLLSVEESRKHQAFTRFEHERPNDLWQMDFKGHFAIDDGRCHPLTVVDDHSRYCVALQACAQERGETVRERLTSAFRHYGLPGRMLMDNGPPWGGGGAEYPWTPLTLWLVRLGVGVSHGRPYHPQTQGKDERFHRTLKAEVLNGHRYGSLVECQHAFDQWRETYNLRRPHEALGMETPVRRYAVSERTFPETLPAIEYAPDAEVRKVQGQGEVCFRGREYVVGRAFHRHPVGLRATEQEGVWDVFFCAQRIGRLDERNGTVQTARGAGTDDDAAACQASARSARSGPAREGVTHVPERV